MPEISSTKDKLKLAGLYLICTLVFFALLGLGFWQLQRVAEKQALLQQMQARQAILISQADQLLIGPVQQKRYQPLELPGQYQGQEVFFLDNRSFNGRPGYQVFAPFRAGQLQPLLLVRIGWAEADPDRTVLPKVALPQDPLILKGRLNLLPGKPMFFGDDNLVAQGAVWQYFDREVLAAVLGQQVYPLAVELDPEQNPDHFLTLEPLEVRDDWVSRHQAYAFQWFTLGLVFLVLCAVLWRRSVRKTGE